MKRRSIITGQKNTGKVTLEVSFHLKQQRVNDCSILDSKYQFGEIPLNCNPFVALIKDKQEYNCLNIVNCKKLWFTYIYQENSEMFFT